MDFLLQLWHDDTLLQIRRHELLQTGEDQSNVERDIERVRDRAAACLHHDEMTVTEIIITSLCAMRNHQNIARRWILHRFASARIYPLLFGPPPYEPLAWIVELRELLDCIIHTMHQWPLITDQFPIALVQARLH